MTMLYLFSAKQYHEPNVCVEVVTTMFYHEDFNPAHFIDHLKKNIGALVLN